MDPSFLEKQIKTLATLALAEDVGSGDVTSMILVDSNCQGRAVFLAKEPLTVCGHRVVREVFAQADSELVYRELVPDGDQAESGVVISEVQGRLRAILTAERTALNFMQRLCGIAAISRRAAQLVRGLRVRVLDTRKTTPGWRLLEKYAVKVGGCDNHRIGLYDAVLIKNNHVDALNGGVREAVEKCRREAPAGMKIQVEVRNMEELRGAVEAKPDAVLLDNMSPQNLRCCVQYVRAAERDRVLELEASGGVTLANLREIAETGVDSVSMGMLTHSAPAADVALRFSPA